MFDKNGLFKQIPVKTGLFASENNLFGKQLNGSITIQDTIPEAEFQMLASNYSGSGDFLNELASPHSGANQTDYDMVQSAAMTFNTNKFILDGTNYFQVASNNSWLADISKESSNFAHTFCAIHKVASTGYKGFMGTSDGGGQQGLSINMYSATQNRIYSSGGSTTATGTGIAVNDIVFTALTISPTTCIAYVGAAAVSTATTITTGGTNAEGKFAFGAVGSSAGVGTMQASGTELYGIIAINKTCSASEIADIRSFMETELGVTT